MIKECKWCKSDFETRNKLTRYCSIGCRREKDRKRQEDKRKPKGPRLVYCAECGGQFNTTQPAAKFCSFECRNAADLRRKAALYKEKPIINCAFCGKETRQTSKNKRFCSKKCIQKSNYYKDADDAARAEAVARAKTGCKNCGSSMEHSYGDFCSEDCSLEHGYLNGTLPEGRIPIARELVRLLAITRENQRVLNMKWNGEQTDE